MDFGFSDIIDLSRALKQRQNSNVSGSKVTDSEDTKPLKIRVKSQDGNDILFYVKPTTSMGKLQKSYCDRMGIALESARFMLDGKPLSRRITIQDMDLDEESAIEVFLEQDGGGSS